MLKMAKVNLAIVLSWSSFKQRFLVAKQPRQTTLSLGSSLNSLLSAYRLKGHFFCQMALLFMIDPISRHISRTSHVLRIFDFVLFN